MPEATLSATELSPDPRLESRAVANMALMLAGSFLEKLPAWSVPLGAGLSMLAVVGLLAANKEFQKI